jgi:hypothetical protein
LGQCSSCISNKICQKSLDMSVLLNWKPAGILLHRLGG